MSNRDPLATSPLESIDWGSAQSDLDVTVYFARAGERLGGETALGWSAYERARAMAALETYAEVAPLSFRIVSDSRQADFKLATAAWGGQAGLAWFSPPGERFAGVGVFNVDGAGWNPERGARSGLETGGMAFETLVHEFGHGLGLAHPHDRGGDSARMDGVTRAFGSYGSLGLNKAVFTVMSYNEGGPAGDGGVSRSNAWGQQTGPAALDIAVLQAKYGANEDFAAGDDVYVLPGRPGRGTGFDAIWDAGGEDEIRFAGDAAAVIDLREATLEGPAAGGYVSSVRGTPGGFTIAAGATIENATGGSGGDRLSGNEAGNRLDGGAGGDRLDGRAGDDLLLGGAGSDAALGGSGDDRALGGPGLDLAYGAAGRDALLGGAGRDLLAAGTGDDALHGGVGDDRLWGQAGDDALAGGTGDDRLIGGSGDDALAGGPGLDRLRGGGGRDRFVFEEAPGRDLILDFVPGEEAIDLSAAGYARADLTLVRLGHDAWRATLDDGAVLFVDVVSGRLSAHDFLFA